MSATQPHAVEAVCRAICEARGTNPNALYQHNFEGDYPEDERREYADPFTGEPRTQLFHRAWRTHDKIARAAIATLRPAIIAEQIERDATLAETAEVKMQWGAGRPNFELARQAAAAAIRQQKGPSRG